MTETSLFPFWTFGFRLLDLFRISRFGFRVFALLLIVGLPGVAMAHPVPKDTHDRTLTVGLEWKPGQALVTVRVKYRLEVDELTAFTKDLEPYRDEIDAFKYRGRVEELYGDLARRLGPDLAFRLVGKANGQRLEFQCVRTAATLHEQEMPLGHLRCDFVFEATFALVTDRDNELVFRDHSYLAEEGKIDLSLGDATGLVVVRKTVPADDLKKRTLVEREPGDDDKLREIRVVFAVGQSEASATPQAVEQAPPANPQAAPEHDDLSLLRLVLHNNYGFALTLLLACLFGAAHALTPGHGKTLVAAYLVGERGTVWHAVVLGIVTTLTHTGIVLLIALVLFCLPAEARTAFGRTILDGLGLAMGLLVTCMGVWLLLQRLAGRADHVHVGGGHHHHHDVSESRKSVGDGTRLTPEASVRWGALILLGITGGLVPCWDAIVLLLAAVGRNEFLFALPMLLAFSAGLAGVLVLIGILVVQVPHFARSRWGNGKLVHALPIASAVAVTLMGVWLCYEGVHAGQ